MYVLYLDIFFLHNSVLIALISLFTLQLLQIRILVCWKRLIVSAVVGSGIETLLLFLCNSYGLFGIGSQLIVMPCVLYFLLQNYKKLSRKRVVIISYTTVFMYVGILNVMVNIFRWDETMQISVIVATLIAEVILLELRRLKKEQSHLYSFEIGVKDRRVCGTALYDSGNCLRAPWDRRAVHIVNGQLLQQLQLEVPRGRVPYQSLGVEYGVLEVYEAEWLIVLSNEKKYRFTNVLLGKTQENLLKNKQYQMILNESVFENNVY